MTQQNTMPDVIWAYNEKGRDNLSPSFDASYTKMVF